jgi:hypothetical protein
MQTTESNKHDHYAPFWAAGLIFLCGTGLATVWTNLGSFWNGYVLDMTGPAWSYILFRGLYTTRVENIWTRFFTPQKTLAIFLVVSFGIETAQYYNLYESTFDPWDYLAYVSILVPLFFLDLHLSK